MSDYLEAKGKPRERLVETQREVETGIRDTIHADGSVSRTRYIRGPATDIIPAANQIIGSHDKLINRERSTPKIEYDHEN